MKKILFILLVINIGCIVDGFSQGPGFAGKKFHVKYDLQYVVPHEDWRTTSFSNLLKTQSHNFQADFALSRLWSIGVGYGIGSEIEDDLLFEKERREVQDLGLYFRRYNLSTGSIAPIGTYFQLGFHRLLVNNHVYTLDYLDNKNTISETPTKENMVSLGIGRQALIFKEGITFHVGGTGTCTIPGEIIDGVRLGLRFNMGLGIAL